MPINDSSSTYPEKLIKSTTATSAPKSNAQLEFQMLLNPSSSSAKLVDNSLIKYQGQKWQQFFDFEKMLKQIRIAEKQNLRNKSDHSTGGGSSNSNNNGKNSTQSTAVSQPKTSSLKCSRQLKQVQRLSGGDMHYYGIVPKQTAIGVVVCNVCRGIYTRVGFNNHMMLQHPSVWSTISTKISTPSTGLVDSCRNFIANDNSQDSVRPDSLTNIAAIDVLGSPSDLSGTMSTCSNASSTSSSLSSAATYGTVAAVSTTPTPTSRHHKSSKNSSSAGGSSSGSNGSRSRSKSSKHHQPSSSNSGSVHASSSSTSSSMSKTGAIGTEVTQISSKPAKKSSNINASTNATTTTPITISSCTTAAAAPTTLISIGGASDTTAITISTATASADTHTQPITIYSSSSSNSSCSLPPTPKMVANSSVRDACTLPAPLENNAFSPASLISLNNAKDKSSRDTSSSLAFIASSQKKSKSPLFIGQESVDSSTSNSSSEYERASSSGTNTSSKSLNAATFAPNARTNNTHAAKKLPMCGKDLKRFSDTQISELDQAVSSITGRASDTKSVVPTSVCMEGIESNLSANTFKMHQPAAMDGIVVTPTTVASGSLITACFQQQQELAQSCDVPMPHNTCDDNSILTLEDMVFDSKFINEILNTADSEIHFDENELDATTQQQATYLQQPAAKRMRFDESVTDGSIGNQQTEISGEFAVFQQQQQQMLQQQQQYAHYNAEHLEDIKVYNAEQLQQLLYQQQQQQQNLNGYGNVDGIGGSTVSAAFEQQEQFVPNSSIVNVNAKQIIDLCAEEDLEKSKNILQGNLSDYTAMTPMIVDEYENSACNALAEQFHIFNVPSLTDDTTEEDGNIVMPSIVNNGRAGVGATQQYVLPGSEDHLIYEITANNQVAVMSQQRQQQVIAEFLTQAGYENIEPNMNSTSALASSATTADNSSKYSIWDDDLLNFDFSCIDTAKSLNSSGTNLNTSGSSLKSEQYKYQDDYYFNVLFYAGVPRPLAMNCFGLIKLPHAAATTFRKNLLTTRKANNSPISLSGVGGINGGVGGINGIVGGSNVVVNAASRLTGINSKSMPNYFTQLSTSGGNPNEFSIGSITITNSPTSTTISPHQVYAQQLKQQQQGSGSMGGPNEITFNAAHNTNGSATSPVSSVLHRVRPKANAGNSTNALGNNNNISSMSSIGKNKSVITLTTPGGGVALNTRATIRPNPQQHPMLTQQNTKTIYVSKTANTNMNASSERVKLIKRGLIARVDIPKSKSKFSPKNIADIVGLSIGGGKSSSGVVGASFNKHQPHQNATDNSQDALQAADEQIKSNRVNRFYERRLSLVNHSRQQQQQLKQKLLQKSQLFRNLSDCSVNSISSHCKNNNNNPNGNSSNDIVRVFV